MIIWHAKALVVSTNFPENFEHFQSINLSDREPQNKGARWAEGKDRGACWWRMVFLLSSAL